MSNLKPYPTAYVFAQIAGEVIHGKVVRVADGIVLLHNFRWCAEDHVFRMFPTRQDYEAYLEEYGAH